MASSIGDAFYFSDGDPVELFVKYKPAKNQRIHQQLFNPREAEVKGVKARGVQMTSKSVSRITSTRPRDWEAEAGPKGQLLKF